MLALYLCDRLLGHIKSLTDHNFYCVFLCRRKLNNKLNRIICYFNDLLIARSINQLILDICLERSILSHLVAVLYRAYFMNIASKMEEDPKDTGSQSVKEGGVPEAIRKVQKHHSHAYRHISGALKLDESTSKCACFQSAISI